MIILLVPWHDLLRKSVPYSLPFKNGFGIRLNISGEKNSVKKNLSSIWTAWRAICSKKNVIHSNGLGYPFEKVVISSNGLGYPFKKEIVGRLSNWSYCKIPKISPSKCKPHKLVMQKTLP